jgi:Spy/CpxP family protein refolding chaperone
MVGVLASVMLAGAFGGATAMAKDKEAKVEQKAEAKVGEMMPGERLENALADLNLTDDQKAKVDAILKPFKEDVAKWREDHKTDLEKAKADLVAAREAKDREKGKAAMQELRKLLETAPKPRDVVEKLKDVLTPEQQDKLKAKIEAVREKARERRKGKGA